MRVRLSAIDPTATIEDAADLFESNEFAGAVIRGSGHVITSAHLLAAVDRQPRHFQDASFVQDVSVQDVSFIDADSWVLEADDLTVLLDLPEGLLETLRFGPRLCRCNGSAKHVGPPGRCPYDDGDIKC